LRGQIDDLRDRLERSQRWAGLDEAHFRAALSCALELIGADPLRPAPASAGPTRWIFPALDARSGADPTWADTLDALRTPRRRDQKPWEWRRQAPLRPAVFQAPKTMTDEVVQLHLAHRVVQRLLGRFVAQGFVHHDLARACLLPGADAIPRVVLVGRLCLYGAGASRLHEELIEVAARWVDPAIGKGRPLTPYGREAEVRALHALESALLADSGRAVTEQVRQMLLSAAARDVRELLPHLQRRGEEMAAEAEEKLGQRGEREARDMRDILERQRQRIADTAAEYREDGQLLLGFDQEEVRQVEANRRHWSARLAGLEKELTQEPERIRGTYRVVARRLEPVGLVYLWPVTG
jgi:hypothetical protein